MGLKFHQNEDDIIYAYFALLLIVVSAILWLNGVTWGEPYGFHSDELRYLTRIVKQPAIPIWTIYGRFPIYFQRMAAWILALPLVDLYLARRLSIVVSISGIIATGLAAKEIGGWKGSLIAVACLSGAPAVVQAAHFFITDVWLWAGVAWSLFFCFRILKTGNWSNIVGLGLVWGIATGSKLSGLFLLPPISLTFLTTKNTYGMKGFLLVCLIAGLVTLIGQPTLLIYGFESYLFKGQLLHHLDVAAGVYLPSYTLQFENTPAWTYYFTNLLWWGAGPFMLLTSCIAMFVIIVLLMRKWQCLLHNRTLCMLVIVLLNFVSFYIMSAGQRDKFSRYILPLLPSLAILSGWLLCGFLRKDLFILNVRIILAIIITFVGWLPGCMYATIYGRLDTRLQAAVWVNEFVPAESVICHEPDIGFAVPPIGMGGPTYGTTASKGYQGILLDWGLLYNASDYLRKKQPAPLSVNLEFENLRTQEQQSKQIEFWLSKCDWIILSDRFADQYLPLPQDFEAISSFYDVVLSDQHFDWRKVIEFRSLPSFLGISIDDRNSELTFRSFDHPTIWVFRRR